MITNHSSYNAVLKQMATDHVEIGHTDDECHFVRVVLNKDPYIGATNQIKEFVNAMGSKLHYPCLIAVAYRAEFSDNKSDNKRKRIDGIYILLDKVREGDHNGEESVYDRTEEIADDILAFFIAHYDENPQDGIFDINNAESEKLANIGTARLYGVKYYFTVDFSATSLSFNPDKFL